MKIKEFGVEIWMNEYEDACELNLAETCVDSLTIGGLLDLCDKRETVLEDLLPMRMTYGAIKGSDRLRDNICELYTAQHRENIIVTHGTISANSLIYETLVSPGSRVISVLPTYQQHYSIPESAGADLQILRLHEKNAFLPDLGDLRDLATGETSLITINNPNNPTGSLMDESFLMEVAEIARACNAYVLCDEVYRGMDQHGDGFTTSMADLYEKGISTAGLSKTYSLAGLRLGWIAGPENLIDAVSVHRDYNTISVGMINDYFACLALENREQILQRNQGISRTNLGILDDWVRRESLISYVKPRSGTTALLKINLDISSHDFCVQLLDTTGVLLTPGSTFEMEGWVRVGYANATDILQTGLSRVSRFLAEINC